MPPSFDVSPFSIVIVEVAITHLTLEKSVRKLRVTLNHLDKLYTWTDRQTCRQGVQCQKNFFLGGGGLESQLPTPHHRIVITPGNGVSSCILKVDLYYYIAYSTVTQWFGVPL